MVTDGDWRRLLAAARRVRAVCLADGIDIDLSGEWADRLTAGEWLEWILAESGLGIEQSALTFEEQDSLLDVLEGVA